MLKIIISGCYGHMGQVVSSLCSADNEIEVVAGFDMRQSDNCGYPVYTSPEDFTGAADAVIDFSNPSALDGLLSFCTKTGTPLVLCTTGYSDAQLSAVKDASEKTAIFKSANMSLGINLLSDLIKRAIKILGNGYDVEIVERHHRRKVDAPSGTALMLADAASEAMHSDPEYIYERQSTRNARSGNEIGISAVRGGTIVGEHEVIFAGLDEVIELKHTAYSREVFASGAIRAAKYIAKVKACGMYDMSDLLSNYNL